MWKELIGSIKCWWAKCHIIDEVNSSPTNCVCCNVTIYIVNKVN